MGTETITPSELLIRALWTPKQTARRLQVSLGTLASWRSEERSEIRFHLPFIVVGGLIRYRPEAIEEYLNRQTGDGVTEPEQRKPGPGRPKASAKRKRK